MHICLDIISERLAFTTFIMIILNMGVKNFFSNWIVKNLLLAALFVIVLVSVVSIVLSVGTRHNKEIEVPDFKNLSFVEAQQLASQIGVQVLIEDSVYVKRFKPGAIYMQTPKAGSLVKEGRKIRLTTNTTQPKKVAMPTLVGFSLRQAKSELQRNGLVLGKLTYIYDMATNMVLRQQRFGRDIEPGDMVTSGSTINLVLGLNPAEETTNVPNIVAQPYQRAIDMLQDNSLNVARLHFDATVETYADSLEAVVFSQQPEFGSDPVRKGTAVSLYLSKDKGKIPKEPKKPKEIEE